MDLSDLSPKETHPIIQLIINHDLDNLKRSLKVEDINTLYPCKELEGSSVSPLLAAVRFQEMDICDFLLTEGANPDTAVDGQTPLYYACQSAPVDFVRRLIKAGARTNLRDPRSMLTPLHIAGLLNKKDVMRVLIDAGALTYLPTIHPQHHIYNTKMSEFIHELASSGEEKYFKTKVFHDLLMALCQKSPREVFEKFASDILEENPLIHLTLIDNLFNTDVSHRERYIMECIKWLEDNNKLNYIENFKRFPNMTYYSPKVTVTVKALQAIFSTMKAIRALIPHCLGQIFMETKEIILVRMYTEPSKQPQREWKRISKRWSKQLEKLNTHEDDKVVKVGKVRFMKGVEFCIANGSDGTVVLLGLRDDGTEVAVKRMTKENNGALKKEIDVLQELYHHSIVRYVDYEEDENFGYLVLGLCEYTLGEYIEDYIKKGIAFPGGHLSEWEIVQQILNSLKILHQHNPPILHRDIKPHNVLIDVTMKARLADFGISRWLPRGHTTYSTSSAGTKCWKAKETITEDGGDQHVSYTKSADIQVAGMLFYYILSEGYHPFGKSPWCEGNILNGQYNLGHVLNVLEKDFIERMINEDPKKRPTVEECIAHPYCWTIKRSVDFLEKVANEWEVDKHKDLMASWDQCAEEGQFSTWKNTMKDRLPKEVFEEMMKRRKKYPYKDDGFGLLRFIRNLCQHHPAAAADIHLKEMFPGLLLCVYKFTLNQGWNTRVTLKDYFTVHNYDCF